MYAVIRLRGSIDMEREFLDTFRFLRLHRKMHCVVLNKNESVDGMLQKVKDWITWGEIDEEILRQLIDKRGRKLGDKRLTKEEAEKIFQEFKKGQKADIKPVFRLTPPSKGFKKSLKQHFPKGELGYRGKEINELLKRMI